MPAIKKSLKKKYGAIIDPNMQDYTKEPFFLSKAAEAKENLSKIKFPKGFFDHPKK
jgi:hypothetical protein